jgi:hypothetical protein
VTANTEPQPAAQHPRDEFCFYCVPEEMLLRGIALHDRGKPWDGPRVHMQVPESFCPVMTEDPEVSE